jgi:L-rhamnose isomerase
MIGGQFAKAVGLDMQGAIETCAQVLVRDHGSQFDDLLGAEVPPQIIEGHIGDFCGRARHPLGVVQDCLFDGTEIRATLELREVG